MKKLMLLATTYMVALFFSCSNDFEVNADWKDIPIVYGLLDIKDSAYYIRLEKAFLPDGEDANAMMFREASKLGLKPKVGLY